MTTAPTLTPDGSPPATDAYDVLRQPLVPAGDDAALPRDLEPLLAAALECLARHDPDIVFSPHAGLIRQLQHVAERETVIEQRRTINWTLQQLRAYFEIGNSDHASENDGRIRLSLTPDRFQAFLTLLPPRADGDMPTLNRVNTALERARIVHGLDAAAVNRAIQIVRETRDIVWCLPVARGEAPVPKRYGRAQYQAPVIDKAAFKRDLKRMETTFAGLRKPVEAFATIGMLVNSSPGRPGTDVQGALVPPTDPEIGLSLGDNIAVSANGSLTAETPGYVIADEQRLDVVPLYVVRQPAPGSMKDFAFPGAVLVVGNLVGPVRIECEDLFILGNCEQIDAAARGDVFIAGGIVGHHKTTVDADGGVYASFISESKVSALDEVAAANAIVNSHVISNQTIRVTSEKGMIAGGSLYALKGLSAATIGSEFGMLTETVVGKDFLTSARMKDISRKIAEHAENLRRIQELKQQLEKSKISIERMPPNKQEIFIGILRKEETSQSELNSLLRQKKVLSRVLGEFVAASIQVMRGLYPPVRVQIGDAIQEIRETLNAVTLTYDKSLGIVSNAADRPKGETPP